MATTMSLIAKQTVGSGGASSVTFSNIPQTFTDLKLVMSTRVIVADVTAYITFTFNSVTSGYSYRYLFGNGGLGAGVFSSSGSPAYVLGPITNGSNSTANTFGNAEVYIANYSATDKSKSISIDGAMENNASEAYAQMWADYWSNNSAINSIQISGNFAEFSTFYLYGISSSSTQNTSVPYASGGDIIRTDGTYWYHTFLYSGTFTPNKALTCDYLVVGGGGSGGLNQGGGGGAGGYRALTSQNLLANTLYTATIGAGGAGTSGSSGSGSQGLSGTSSSFNSTSSAGGGGGGGYNSGTITAGLNGGSGGGGARTTSGGTGNTPSTSPSQGNNGSTGSSVGGYDAGGGGGGASAAGTTTGGGNGSAWLNGVTYAGGGGGATDNRQGTSGYSGGTGGGGTGGGGQSTSGTAGSPNTGGGGGGGPYANTTYSSGSGGSGIIIVRYAV